MTAIPVVVVGFVAHGSGYSSGYRDGLEHGYAQFECQRGDQRSCAFGPAIVGVQICSSFGQKWDKCEPDQKYRVTTEGRP
jgi:hypothetical protein